MENIKMNNLNDDELYVVNLAERLKAVSHPARLCIVKKLYINGECKLFYGLYGCIPVRHITAFIKTKRPGDSYCKKAGNRELLQLG